MTKNLADELQRTARQALTGLHPTPAGEEVGGLSFQRLLAAAFRARYLLLATTVFGLLIGTFMAITTANTYLSRGTFLFSGSGAESMMADPTRSGTTSAETIATGASYILNSDEPRKRVVAKLGAARILEPYQPRGLEESGLRALFFRIQRDWNATREEDRTDEAALRYLQKAVTVERPRFADVLLVNCIANDAQLAQEICSAFMVEAKNVHIEKYEDTRAYESARKAWEDAQARHKIATGAMREFLERKAMVDDFDNEKKRLQTAVSENQTELDAAVTEQQTTRKIIEAWQQQLTGPNKIEPTTIETVTPSLNEGAIAGHEGDLGELYERLSLMQRGDPNNPEIVNIERRIAAKKDTLAKLREDARSAPPEERRVANPLYVAAQTDLSKAMSEMVGLDTKVQLLTAQKEQRVNALKAINELEADFAMLRKAAIETELAAESARTTWDAVERKKALGEGNFSTLKEAEMASLPLEKEGPNRGKLLIGGLFVGLFLGLGIIVLRTLPDSVVRTREDLENIEGLAVIGVMPRLDGGNLRRHVALRERGW